MEAEKRLTQISEIPQEQPTSIRAGVFICNCGGNISSHLDTVSLSSRIKTLPDVVFVSTGNYPCSRAGRKRLQDAVINQQLNRIVVAGCSPRLIEKLFQQDIQPLGLGPECLEIANIREQCVFVHPNEPNSVIDKAASQINISLARLSLSLPVIPHKSAVTKAVTIFGASLAGLTLAVDLARAGFPVSLIDPDQNPTRRQIFSNDNTRELINQLMDEVFDLPMVNIHFETEVTGISGSPGNYQVKLKKTDRIISLVAGALVLATDPQPACLDTNHWYDRKKILSQSQFQEILLQDSFDGDTVMLLCSKSQSDEYCSRLCCQVGIQQAIQAKKLKSESNVFVIFRNLFLGKEEALLREAIKLGVTFYRYPENHPPNINDKTIDLYDPLCNDHIHIPYQRLIVATPLLPDKNLSRLASILQLPRDPQGYLIEPHLRLRPGNYVDDGVFVLAGAHQPTTMPESLFQAYLVSHRVQDYLNKNNLINNAPVAIVDKALCTGCGECAQVCFIKAVHFESQADNFSLSTIDPLRCTGCGNCAVACPVKAISIPGYEDSTILAQISAALSPHPPSNNNLTPKLSVPTPRILVLACEWSAYAAADLAGTRHLPYPASIRILRMNCSARFDPNHILWAFLNGASGVLLGACPAGECHYGAGNEYSKRRVEVLQNQLAEHGFDPGRLRIEFIPGDDAKGFVSVIEQFVNHILNPISSIYHQGQSI